MPRTGIFICHCGSNIAGTVDIARAIDASRNFPGVVHVDEYRYLCSEMGQDLIKNAIKENDLDRVVVGTCSPRMHEGTFRKAATEAPISGSTVPGCTAIWKKAPRRRLLCSVPPQPR